MKNIFYKKHNQTHQRFRFWSTAIRKSRRADLKKPLNRFLQDLAHRIFRDFTHELNLLVDFRGWISGDILLNSNQEKRYYFKSNFLFKKPPTNPFSEIKKTMPHHGIPPHHAALKTASMPLFSKPTNAPSPQS